VNWEHFNYESIIKHSIDNHCQYKDGVGSIHDLYVRPVRYFIYSILVSSSELIHWSLIWGLELHKKNRWNRSDIFFVGLISQYLSIYLL